MEGNDAGKIRSGIQNVTEAAMRLGEAIYKARAAEVRRGSVGRRGRTPQCPTTISWMRISRISTTTSVRLNPDRKRDGPGRPPQAGRPSAVSGPER